MSQTARGQEKRSGFQLKAVKEEEFRLILGKAPFFVLF